jgi:hypothetical protein
MMCTKSFELPFPNVSVSQVSTIIWDENDMLDDLMRKCKMLHVLMCRVDWC